MTEIPKTAAQHNPPICGDIKIGQPAPASTIPPKPEPLPLGVRALQEAQAQPGWRIDSTHAGHKGLKAEVLAEIELCPKLPAHWKRAIIAEIAAMDCTALEVHAHCSVANGSVVPSFHFKRLF